MANLTETATYDAGVTQIDTGALISGGASGTANAPLKNLANRTAYLKSQLDTLTTIVGSGSSGATGAAGDAVFVENDQSVTANYTLTAGKNAMTAGPITINSGVTVTVPTGATWSIV